MPFFVDKQRVDVDLADFRVVDDKLACLDERSGERVEIGGGAVAIAGEQARDAGLGDHLARQEHIERGQAEGAILDDLDCRSPAPKRSIGPNVSSVIMPMITSWACGRRIIGSTMKRRLRRRAWRPQRGRSSRAPPARLRQQIRDQDARRRHQTYGDVARENFDDAGRMAGEQRCGVLGDLARIGGDQRVCNRMP